MKSELFKMVIFVCMIVVLGLQELLYGSWKIPEMASKKSNEKESKYLK